MASEQPQESNGSPRHAWSGDDRSSDHVSIARGSEHGLSSFEVSAEQKLNRSLILVLDLTNGTSKRGRRERFS
ncbi:hypothetical protein QA600_21995, partial [Natronococcus sp. A-GB1]|uniref:hypothetical protein n=1 Tax=Natronococcus sp. A-GB1 TaxID=3037648 RepID=UPI00241CB1EE